MSCSISDPKDSLLDSKTTQVFDQSVCLSVCPSLYVSASLYLSVSFSMSVFVIFFYKCSCSCLAYLCLSLPVSIFWSPPPSLSLSLSLSFSLSLSLSKHYFKYLHHFKINPSFRSSPKVSLKH